MTATTDFWVGDRLVRPSLGEIQLGPERIHLEPRSVDVLLALADRAPEVVPKQELIDTVWGETFVSDEVLTHAIWDLRRAFGDNASDPEFIQTIPKRGYRLIAPLKPVGPLRRRATDQEQEPGETGRGRRLSRSARWGGLLVIAALIGLVGWAIRGKVWEFHQEHRAAALVLVSAAEIEGAQEMGARLDAHLSSKLVGLPGGVLVRTAPSCEVVAGATATYCLEPRLNPRGGGYEINAELRDAVTREPLYSSPVRQLEADGELGPPATEIAELVTACFEVLRDPYSKDPDIEPWFSLQRHDPRAVKSFLLGMKFVWRHETGGADAMQAAMEQDPGFVAPWAMRTPTIAASRDEEAIARHRGELKSLSATATGFEKAMIDWAVALLDEEYEVAARQLQIALEESPGNRPVLHVLGALRVELEDFEDAWRAYDELLDSNWDFPGLYPPAARCAQLRDRLEDVRSVLARAQEVYPIDPDTLSQLELLAIFDDDDEGAARHRRRLEIRKRQMKPEIVQLPYRKPTADYLAAKAEAAGRHQIAARLRESAD